MESNLRHRFRELNNLSLTLNLGSHSSELLYWGFIEAEVWRNYRHIHSFFEVCYAYQGEGQFRISGETLTVAQGDIFFARPNEPHDILSSQENPLGIHFWAYTLVPTASTTGDQSEHEEMRSLLTNYMRSSQRRGDASPTLERTIELLVQEIVQQEPGSALTIRGLATNLLVETARLGCDSNQRSVDESRHAQSGSESAVVLQIKRYLQDNYGRPVRLNEIAAQVHLSERHVCRIFNQETSTTIQKYLAEIRLDVAKQLLLDPDTAVTDVANATGFSDVRYFSTFFRRATGDTPSAFRQKRGTAFLTANQP